MKIGPPVHCGSDTKKKKKRRRSLLLSASLFSSFFFSSDTNSPIDAWQHGHEAGPNGAIGWITGRLDPRVGPLHRGKPRGARGGTQGGLNCLTHTCSPDAFRRRLRRRMEEGPECCRRAEGSLGPPSGAGAVTALVPLLLTGVQLHPPGRTDENLCRCFGAPARRVFPDHLISSEVSK